MRYIVDCVLSMLSIFSKSVIEQIDAKDLEYSIKDPLNITIKKILQKIKMHKSTTRAQKKYAQHFIYGIDVNSVDLNQCLKMILASEAQYQFSLKQAQDIAFKLFKFQGNYFINETLFLHLYDRYNININAVDENGDTLFMVIMKYDNVRKYPIIERVFNDVEDVYHNNKEGKNLMQQIAEIGNEVTYEILLEKGVRVNHIQSEAEKKIVKEIFTQPLNYGILSLSENCTHNRKNIVESIDIDMCGEHGESALHYAAMHGNIVMVKKLLQVGLDVNALDMEGNTVLMYSCERGDIDIFKYLLENGADKNIGNSYGETPLVLAERLKQKDVIQLLREDDKTAEIIEIRSYIKKEIK